MYFQIFIKNIWAFLLCLIAVPGFVFALGIDAVKANEFISACRISDQATTEAKTEAKGDENETDGEPKVNLCFSYLQGYFAGTNEIVTTEDLPSDFTLRVLRTRGQRLNDAQQKLLDSRYCISEKESLKDFAAKVALLDTNFSQDSVASEAVKLVLEQHFICKRD